MALRLLPRRTSPTLTIVSRTDKMVPIEVADLIADRSNTSARERLVLEDSSHVVINDSAKEQVAGEIISWLGP
jgi:esterase/lipase